MSAFCRTDVNDICVHDSINDMVQIMNNFSQQSNQSSAITDAWCLSLRVGYRLEVADARQ